MRTDAKECVASLAPRTQPNCLLAVSVKPTVMEPTSAAVATVGAGVDVVGLVGTIQTNPQLPHSVSICLLRLRQRQYFLQLQQRRHLQPLESWLAASVKPTVMVLTSVAVATVGAGADVDGLVERIQTNLQLAHNVSIQPLDPLQPLDLLHQPPGQIPICRRVVAVHGLALQRPMCVATAHLGARRMRPIARRAKVIGLAPRGHAQHPLLPLFQLVVAARGP